LEEHTSVNRNLFLIGAGFTKAIFPDAPLNKDLLGVLCQGTQSTTLKRYYREHKTDDIEILLTRLDLDILHPKAKKQAALQTVRKMIEQELAEYFVKYRFRGEVLDKSDWLKEFVNFFRLNDAIINLNYDCFLEGILDYCEVWSPKGGYALLDSNPLLGPEFPQNEKNIRVFKLHGSEHFIEAPDPTNLAKSSIDFPIDESIYPRSGKNRVFGYGCGVPGAHSYIIAPSFVKIPHQDIELMMIEALKVAASANNFVIIGCSIRHEDSFLWLLITSFLNQPPNNRKLIIVDPCAKKLADRIIGHYFVDIHRFVQIKTLTEKLETAVLELRSELQETST
jgi:hypothetical protein